MSLKQRRRSISFELVLDVLAFLVPLAVYCASLSPWPDGWDYGEFETVPYILGIAHPTGFPAYILLGWLFSHVVAIGTVAFRMKLLSALCIAGSALVLRRLARSFGAGEWPSFFAALAFGATDIAWTKGTHADVHAMALLLTMVVFKYALAYAKNGISRDLIVACLAYGFGLATHPNVLWSGLALVPGIVWFARANVRRLPVLAIALVAPLSLVVYIPIRATIIEATHVDPAGVAPISYHGDVDWDKNRPTTPAGFLIEMSGNDGNAGGTLAAVFDFRQYPTFFTKWFAVAAEQVQATSIVLAVLGLIALVRLEPRTRTAAFWVVAAAFAPLPFAYSYSVEADTTRYVFASLAIVFALAACSARALTLGRATAGALVTVVLAIVAWTTLQSHIGHFAWRTDHEAQPVIDGVVRTTPGDAIVLTVWLDLTPLGYGAYVDHSLGDRVPIEFLSADVDLYRQWSATRHVYALTDFINTAEVQRTLASCLHEVPAFDADHHLYEIRCGKSVRPASVR